MANQFKPDDKVLTKHKGVEVEATVRLVWNGEVQVRTPDGVLRWRTVKTVWPASAPAAVSKPGIQLPGEAVAATPSGGAESVVQPDEATPAPSNVDHTAPVPAADVQPPTQAVQDDTQGVATVQPKLDVVPCGAADEQPKSKRSRKSRRRR